MWKGNAERTNFQEVKNLLASERLILCREQVNATAESGEASAGGAAANSGLLVGSVMVNPSFAKGTGELGMLAVSRLHLRLGIGRALVGAAERCCQESGCDIMRLELLEPSSYKHEFKAILDKWYASLGYARGEPEDFGKLYPSLAPLLSCPCVFSVYLKNLN